MVDRYLIRISSFFTVWPVAQSGGGCPSDAPEMR